MRPTSVLLAAEVHTALVAAARQAGAREFVGLLAGRRDDDRCLVTTFVPLANLAVRDDHFAVDPIAFAHAEAELRTRGLDWLGFVHSHPHGPAAPSRSDRAELWRDCVQLIVAGASCAAFWFAGELCTALPLQTSARGEVA